MRNFISRILAWVGLEVRRTVDGAISEFKKVEQRLETALNFHRAQAKALADASAAHSGEAGRAARYLTKVKSITE